MQDFFGQISGTEFFDSRADERMAQDLFAVGFGYTAAEYDQMGIDPDAVHAAREDFFDFMGLEYEDFDWEGWREEMGYEDA
jgi:hypothetical protein